MDCKLIQELLIDYIDEELDGENEKMVKEHLDNCSDCIKEYKEIKSTIDYIVKNSNNIDTEKDVKLNTKVNKINPIMNIGRIGAIAISISLILLVTAFATDIFGIFSWKELSDKSISEWERLIENGVGQKLDISVIDKDIKITAEGIIADELNTIIVLKIEDIKGKNRLTPDWDFTPESRSIYLSGEILKREGWAEDIPLISSIDPLYSEKDNTTRIKISTHAINKNEGDIEIHINRLIGVLGLYNATGLEVEGNWDLTIPVKLVESKIYFTDDSIDLDGNRLTIRKITIAPTITNIEYELEILDEEKDEFISNIVFSIKDGTKTYERSNIISSSRTTYSPSGSVTQTYNIESLFLQDPKMIDLIINSYEIATGELKSYDVDWDDLPQEVEYRESKITIEDIEYTDDSTRVVIKEDESKDREYINSKLSFKIVEDLDNEDEDHFDQDEYTFYGHPTDWDVKDSKGKVIDKYNELWNDEYYSYVFKQELILSEEYFKGYDMNPDNYKDYLIPGKLYIEGQRYKKFPNRKSKLKLK